MRALTLMIPAGQSLSSAVRSGPRGAPVPQEADRVFGLAVVPDTSPLAARGRADWASKRRVA